MAIYLSTPPGQITWGQALRKATQELSHHWGDVYKELQSEKPAPAKACTRGQGGRHHRGAAPHGSRPRSEEFRNKEKRVRRPSPVVEPLTLVPRKCRQRLWRWRPPQTSSSVGAGEGRAEER